MRSQTAARLVAHVQRDAVGELPGGVEPAPHPVSDGARRAAAGLLLRTDGELVHGLDVDLPLRYRGPRVITVHDLSVFDVAWAHDAWRGRGERALVSRAIRRADEIVAVSGFTAERIQGRFGRSSTVTHLAPRAGLAPATGEAVEWARRQYGLSSHTVLCVGTIEPRKRVTVLAEACEAAGLPLALAGALGAGERLPARARHLGYVESEHLPALYGAAGAVAYASCYEGFGLPPVEAMACGGAVVATRVGALPEVVGEGALLVRPDDVLALADALRRAVLDRDTNAALREAGPRVASGLSWARTASATLDVYRGLGVPC